MCALSFLLWLCTVLCMLCVWFYCVVFVLHVCCVLWDCALFVRACVSRVCLCFVCVLFMRGDNCGLWDVAFVKTSALNSDQNLKSESRYLTSRRPRRCWVSSLAAWVAFSSVSPVIGLTRIVCPGRVYTLLPLLLSWQLFVHFCYLPSNLDRCCWLCTPAKSSSSSSATQHIRPVSS